MWRIPVIRGEIGNWRYYTGIMTFGQISKHVTSSVKEFYQATCLNELLQRDLTENYNAIKEYLLNDRERFFNALILAIYNGDPQWLEIEFEEREYCNVGFLEFTEEETIFPVDGQHRVAGIKKAVTEEPALLNESVPVVFVAHYPTPEGQKRTRKLFSTLNRRAKPVGQNENIALDEDDVCAIITRELMQTIPLLMNDNVAYIKGKQLPRKNEEALTSLIALYQAVCIVVQRDLELSDKRFSDYKLYRPDEGEIERHIIHAHSIFEAFSTNTSVIKEFQQHEGIGKTKDFRNAQGGNILFRPMVFPIYFDVALMIAKEQNTTINEAFSILNNVPQRLNARPWLGLLWDGQKIINRLSHVMIKNMLLFMTCSDVLSPSILIKFEESYAKALTTDIETAREYLAPFKDCWKAQ